MTVVVKDEPLVVPPSVRRKAGLKRGDALEFRVSGQVITISPRKPRSSEDLTAHQRAVIERDLSKGLEDVRRGRVQGPFTTHDEFTASLHREAAELQRKKTRRAKR